MCADVDVCTCGCAHVCICGRVYIYVCVHMWTCASCVRKTYTRHTSGRWTKPNDCGRVDLLVMVTGATTHSCSVQGPKSTLGTLNSMSEEVS